MGSLRCAEMAPQDGPHERPCLPACSDGSCSSGASDPKSQPPPQTTLELGLNQPPGSGTGPPTSKCNTAEMPQG